MGECSQFPDLPELLNQGQFLVPRLTSDEIRSAIEDPARMFGANLHELLVTRLLNDISNDSDQLPLLQHALKRMWDLSDRSTGGSPVASSSLSEQSNCEPQGASRKALAAGRMLLRTGS